MGIEFTDLLNVITYVKAANGSRPDITLDGDALYITYTSAQQIPMLSFFMRRYGEIRKDKAIDESYSFNDIYAELIEKNIDLAKAGDDFDVIELPSPTWAKMQLVVSRDDQGAIRDFQSLSVRLNFAELERNFPAIKKSITDYETLSHREKAAELVRSQRATLISGAEKDYDPKNRIGSRLLTIDLDRNLAINKAVAQAFVFEMARQDGVRIFSAQCVEYIPGKGAGYKFTLPYFPGKRTPNSGLKPIREYQVKVDTFAEALKGVFGDDNVQVERPKETPTRNDQLVDAKTVIIIAGAPSLLAEAIKQYDGAAHKHFEAKARTFSRV